MFTELAFYNHDSTFKDLLSVVFTSAQKRVDCVAIPSGFMSRLTEFTNDQKFSVAIDFPYGLSGTSVRVHEIILAIRQGASYIDLVLNNSFIKERYKKVYLSKPNEPDFSRQEFDNFMMDPQTLKITYMNLFYL